MGYHTILIDCDGPVFNTHQLWLEELNRCEKELSTSDVFNQYSSLIDYAGGDEQFHDNFLTKDAIINAPAICDVVESVRILRNMNHKIIFVSRIPKPLRISRTKRIRNMWRSMGYEIRFDFDQSDDSDRALIKSKVLIDDNLDNINKYLSKSKNRVGLVWARPWNVYTDPNNVREKFRGRVFWVWSWSDIIFFILNHLDK